MASKTLLISISLAGCTTFGSVRIPKNVKVYEIETDTNYCHAAWCQGRVGLVRVQSQEIKDFLDSGHMYCVSKTDLIQLAQACPNPK